jgi:hypothetical protein
MTCTQPQALALKTSTLGTQGIFIMRFVQYMSQKKGNLYVYNVNVMVM